MQKNHLIYLSQDKKWRYSRIRRSCIMLKIIDFIQKYFNPHHETIMFSEMLDNGDIIVHKFCNLKHKHELIKSNDVRKSNC